MDLERFVHSPVGTLVAFRGTDPRTGRPHDHKAFLPSHLPAQVDLGRPAVLAITTAMLALGRLDQALQWITNPMRYIRPAIRREAVSTSALEGTFAAFEDVMGADILDEPPNDPSLTEVLNFVRAAERALEWAQDRRITVSLLCELQRILVRGTSSDGRDTGNIRTTPVLIGPKGCAVEQARFIPPLPDDTLKSGIDDWEQWIDRMDDIPLLARIAVAHYQFETLHPFTDGNGRIGRLVILLQLVGAGVLSYPMLNISTWFYARRDEYIDHLLLISQTGDFDPWIVFFCEAITQESESAVTRIASARDWREGVMEKIRKARIRTGAVHTIADGLIGHPVLSPTWVQHHYKISYPTSNAALLRLQQLGILQEVTGRNYGRVFAATELLEIFNV